VAQNERPWTPTISPAVRRFEGSSPFASTLKSQVKSYLAWDLFVPGCQIRSQARELLTAAEGVLTRELPLSDGELAYLAGVVNFADEFLDSGS
jgi:hypothetical protein